MNAAAGELALKTALSPWERRLKVESLERWLLRGAVAALAAASAVLLVGWVVPIPEADLRPWALVAATLTVSIAVIVAVWPRRRLRTTADLDQRLNLGDRLATAWSFRTAEETIARLQRDDALRQLGSRAPKRDLHWTPSRLEWAGLGLAVLVAVLLLGTPSPQQRVLDAQAAQADAVRQADAQLDTLRQQAEASATLSPDQLRQLDELLQQAQAQLKEAQTEQEAANVVARTQDQLAQQLGDPNADLRDEALAAMSETLSAEPQTKALGDALQREDAQAASQSIKDIADHADQLSDVERQSLARALQRAANVGRADAKTSNALRDASQALASNGDPKQASEALSQADAALRQSIQASQSQAALNATQQQLRELQNRLASGQPLTSPADQQAAAFGIAANATPQGLSSGTPVALDNTSASQTVSDPSQGQGGGAGSGPGTNGYAAQAAPGAQAAENVFVPGRPNDSPGDQPQPVDQPFTVRGAPRPYRDVLNQYAQSSRDYVDRPDISPAVRDLVKQYFRDLESGQ